MQKYLKFYLCRCSGFKHFQEYIIYINMLLFRRFFKMLSSLHFNTLTDLSLRGADRNFIVLNGNQFAVLSIYKFKTCYW